MSSSHKSCESGHATATPGCNCGYCRAVFDDWGKQAVGFQEWMNALSPARLDELFGLKRGTS